MKVPVWVLDDAVVAIHKRQLAEHGGSAGVRDPGLLASALARPKNAYAYDSDVSLARLAAEYAFGIARNHAFVDGNKRTAFVVCLLFLRLNGKDINATQEEKYATFIQLASGELSVMQLEKWIEPRLRKWP
ncbi:MAG: type II toxin-antitoxin system death-on-curing family toxin [Burkholderiales bacterium]|nr:type II toxin-antitoxin system death-on-curing family toxin [Burkholderiales bacterium]